MDEPLDIRHEGEVVHATLCRPEQLNALNTPLITALAVFFEDLASRPEVRVVMMQAAGRLFCAGVDLKERPPTSVVGAYEGMRRQRMFARVVQAMRRCPQPIITIVHGTAAGGGMALHWLRTCAWARPTPSSTRHSYALAWPGPTWG